MAYIQVDDFKNGLDVRRLAFMTSASTLLKARNVHINRGGEVEKRKAFVSHATLPANTFGLLSMGGLLYVFGSVVDPAMPSGYAYQRLQHPDGASMVGVVRARLFGAKAYVLADFSDGSRLHFYDAALVTHWYGGVTRSAFVNNSGIATHLASLIDAHPEYSASAVGSVITVTGPLGRAFTVTPSTTNGGAVGDQTLVTAVTQFAVAVRDEVPGVASFRITGGSSNPGVNYVDQLTAAGTTLFTTNIDWTASNANTAQLVADSINLGVSSPDYTAVAVGDVVEVRTAPGAGATVNGSGLSGFTAGNVVTITGGFEITAGTLSAGVNKITSVTIDGFLVASNVDWGTSNDATAAAVAAAIIAGGDVAYADGPNVMVGGNNGAFNKTTGLKLDIVCGGNVRVRDMGTTVAGVATLNSTLNNNMVAFSGGVAAYAGISQQSTITVGGTFDVGDRFQVIINDLENGDMVFGAGIVSGERATDILTLGTKMYAASGPLALFSAVNDPTLWNYGTGAGFTSMSANSSGLTSINGLCPYEKAIAYFGADVVQIWSVDPDPDNNSIFQTLENIGTEAGKSIQAYGGIDTYFLHSSGFRSLRQRANTSLASTYDIGTSIDDEIVASITDDPVGAAAAISVIEPETNRYWCYLNGKIYVLTQFAAEGIEAWSTYEDVPAFTEFEKLNRRLYGRAGNTVYLYGGTDNATYDDCTAEVTLPYLNARKIATWKQWKGLDVAVSGVWDVYANTDPDNPTTEDLISRVSGVTYHNDSNLFDMDTTAIKLRFVSTSASRALISGVTIHYDEIRAT